MANGGRNGLYDYFLLFGKVHFSTLGTKDVPFGNSSFTIPKQCIITFLAPTCKLHITEHSYIIGF
jgi:hypothetical protein